MWVVKIWQNFEKFYNNNNNTTATNSSETATNWFKTNNMIVNPDKS